MGLLEHSAARFPLDAL